MEQRLYPPEGSAIRIVAHSRRALLARGRAVTLALLLVTVVIFGLALIIGDYPVALPDIVTSLLSPLTGARNPGTDFIVLTVRLPRAVMGLLAGAAFGLSGLLFQTLLRNALASPDIIGISTGASAAAVAGIVLFGWAGLLVSFFAALAGALLTALAIYLLAYRQGVSPYRVVLVGIGMAAILAAAISYVLTRARLFEVQRALAWLVGSLNGSSFAEAAPLALTMLVLVPLAFLLARPLGTLQLGDDTALALGTRVNPVRVGLMLIAVALSAFATAAVGPVAFVAFVAGPIARRLIGQAGSGFLPAMLVGAIVTIGSDLVAQHLLPATQLPVGIVTGAIGAVFLIYLLTATNRSGQGA